MGGIKINKLDLVNYFLDNNYLISPDFVNKLPESFNSKEFLLQISTKIKSKEKPVLLNNDLRFVVDNSPGFLDINWQEFEHSKAMVEKQKDGKIYSTFLDILNYGIVKEKTDKIDQIIEEVKKPEKGIPLVKEVLEEPSVIVLKSYKEEAKKREIQDFVKYFRLRYENMKGMLQNRSELKNLVSISRIKTRRGNDEVSVIGLVSERRITKNGNLSLRIEDFTGSVHVIIKNDREVFELGQRVLEDEMIGVKGTLWNHMLFVNELIFPDIPLRDIKKSSEEGYATFISDLQVGSKMFLGEDFAKFIKWINGKMGNPIQRSIAKKVKYLFIVGDIAEGIGIYPGQDKELNIKDIQKQYEKCAEYLSQVRKDVKIIISPGNHDALRLAEPQPVLPKDFAKALYDLPNVVMVSNPSIVNIHSSKEFTGFNVLLYHGNSFDYYINNIDEIRMNGAYDRGDLVMKCLLQKRHLGPSHNSVLHIPDTKKDALIIDKDIDFFICGHLHYLNISKYHNIDCISCACWQEKTAVQEKRGQEPDISKVPIVNLKTREIKVMRFGK